jgi:hypothetical protein
MKIQRNDFVPLTSHDHFQNHTEFKDLVEEFTP